MVAFVVVVGVVLLGVIAFIWSRLVALRRERYIRTFILPKGLFEKLCQRRPGLTIKDCQLVARALRQFFLAYLWSGRKFVSMPSQVADDLWHEFILYTRNYQVFCANAFGGFLHHTPAIVLGSNRQSNAGLRRCWWYSCKEEHINPRSATRLPLLFALDAKLKIAQGFIYALDCRSGVAGSGNIYCAADMGSPSFDGSDEGFADGAAGGDGDGGCGGGGCGGD